jgi:uncharacterized RDD family membrane protein YckC
LCQLDGPSSPAPGSRFVAALIDGLVMSVLTFVLFIAAAFGLAFLSGAGSRQLRTPEDTAAILPVIGLAMLLAIFVALWGYHVFFEMVWHGQTPGKRAMGLRVIKEGG